MTVRSIATTAAAATAAAVAARTVGSGIAPATSRVAEDTPMPFKRQITIDPDVDMLQVVAVGKSGSQGCRITLDGTVVAEEPIGGSAHCVWTRFWSTCRFGRGQAGDRSACRCTQRRSAS